MSRERIAFTIAALLVAAAIIANSYTARRDLAFSQWAQVTQDCARGQKDRHANADGWYNAYLARARSAKLEPANSTQYQTDTKAAFSYFGDAVSLNSRTSKAWSVKFVRAGRWMYPLGVGHLNCAKAHPRPSVPLVRIW